MRLYICPFSPESAELYRNAADAYNRTPQNERNSGFDLYCGRPVSSPQELSGGPLHMIGQGCRALAVDEAGSPRAYWLVPRSSMSKSPWRLANSIGLIDATYRGILIAALDGPREPAHGTRLVQVAAPDLVPWSEVIVVDELPGQATSRGAGGFGSTG